MYSHRKPAALPAFNGNAPCNRDTPRFASADRDCSQWRACRSTCGLAVTMKTASNETRLVSQLRAELLHGIHQRVAERLARELAADPHHARQAREQPGYWLHLVEEHSGLQRLSR